MDFAAAGVETWRPVRLYVGDYESGAVPVADTDPATALPETVTLAPGTYRFLAVGKGVGPEGWKVFDNEDTASTQCFGLQTAGRGECDFDVFGLSQSSP